MLSILKTYIDFRFLKFLMLEESFEISLNPISLYIK